MNSNTNPLTFQKVKKENHFEYHLPLDSNLDFFDYRDVDDSLEYILRDNLIDTLGLKNKDFFRVEEDILIYSMILNYFAEDRELAISSSSLSDIAESLEPIEAYWNYNLSYGCYTKTPLAYVEGFEHYGGAEIASIKKEMLSSFSLGYSDPVQSWTFFMGAKYDELLAQINNPKKKPNVDTILYISDYIVSINYGEEEGHLGYVLIQSQNEIDEEVAHLESLLKTFKEQFEAILSLIEEDEVLEEKLMLELKQVYETKPLQKEIYDLKSEVEKVDWEKIEIQKEEGLSIVEAIMLISQGRHYQSLGTHIYDEMPSLQIIPFLLKIITFGNRQAKLYSYSYLKIILFDFSESKRHYQAILGGLELYLDELEHTTDGELAGFILDILDELDNDEKLFIDKLETIKEHSSIGEYLNRKPKNIYSTRKICNEGFRKRPAMYTGEHTLESIFRFISAQRLALHEHNLQDIDKPDFHEFHEWVKDELGYFESTAGWARMILWYSLGEDVKEPNWEALESRTITKEEHHKSIDLFFEFFDIFYVEGE